MANKFQDGIAEFLKSKSVKLTEEDIDRYPAGYALLSKLTTSRHYESYQNNGELNDYAPNLDYLLGISSEKAQEIDDNEAIMQLLPDLERIAQILISYIISPKYLLRPELQYFPPSGLFTQTIGQQMIEVVKNYLSVDYKLDKRLYGILYNILFTKGAHVVAVIPEASLDELIHSDQLDPDLQSGAFNGPVSMESYSYKLSLESNQALSKLIQETQRKSRGFLGRASYHNQTPSHRGNQLLSTETLSVSTGVEKVERVDNKDTYQDTKILSPGEVSYILPKDLFQGEESEYIDKEGKWNVSIESNQDTLIEVSDDLSLLMQSFAKKQSLSTEAKRLSGLALSVEEKKIKATDRELITKLFKSLDNTRYRPNSDQMKRLASNEQTYRKNLDEPLIIEYPVESIIPIYKPGSPSEHIGYLALHDEEGTPLSKTKPINYYRELHNNYNMRTTGQNMASALIQQGRTMFDGFSNRLDEARQLEILSKIHGNAIIKDILERLRNGLYGKNVDIGEAQEAYRIMFYRSLQGQRTRILFIPKEIMTYMAFDYDAKGMGRSLIDNMKVLISLRIQFMLAQIRAGIMNSIPETVVTLKIDEEDPDPKKTIQIGKVLAVQSRSNAGLIIGASNVQTIEDRINQANVRIAIESDNPKVPQIGQDVSRNTADLPQPDQDTADKLEKFTTLGAGLPPEMVENSYQPEFAEQIVQANFLTNLTSYQKQERFNPYLTEFAKKVIESSPSIRKELTEIVRSNIKDILSNIEEASGDDELDIESLDKHSIRVIIDYIVDKFIAGLEISLPSPSDDNVEVKNEQLSQYEQKIDNAIKYLLSSDALPEDVIGEDGSNYIDKYANVVKADLMRAWMAENNYIGEINDYFTVGKNNEQTYEKNKEIRDISIRMIKSIMDFFKEAKNIAKSTQAVAETNQLHTDESDYSGGDSGSSGDDNDEGDDDFGGDFGGEDEFGIEEETEEGSSGADEELDGSPD